MTKYCACDVIGCWSVTLTEYCNRLRRKFCAAFYKILFMLNSLSAHYSGTLTIHNSLSLSLPAQGLPLSQIFPTIDSLSGLWTDSSFMTGPFLLSISFFYGRPM